jgi:2-amino-4-hydroxy-6-hydroxymethyldihydropteridine diphosphokinase
VGDLIVAAVAIGSNVGDRAGHIQFAFDRLSSLLGHLKTSSIYDTAPVGVPEGQGRFLNAAAVGETDWAPEALLDALLAIEDERGRERPFPLAPRTLDLDLILFGDRVIDAGRVIVPHPRFRNRLFVLEPLAEIAPGLRDPVTGKTVGELLDWVIW